MISLLAACTPLSAAAGQAPITVTLVAEAVNGGMQLRNSREVVRITFCGAGVVHVVATPAGEPVHPAEAQPWIIAPCVPAATTYDNDSGSPRISMGQLSVSANLLTGALRFEDASGNTLLQEGDIQPRRYVPAVVDGEHVYHVSDPSPCFPLNYLGISGNQVAF